MIYGVTVISEFEGYNNETEQWVELGFFNMSLDKLSEKRSSHVFDFIEANRTALNGINIF
jgi:hypothetical protein